MKERTNAQWLDELESTGAGQAAALADARALLLRAARYAFSRNLYDLGRLSREDVNQLAEDSAQDALLTLLKHLREFRGDSKFTTWAYKFGINVALVTARREAWKHVSLDQMLADTDLPDGPFVDEHSRVDPERAAWQSEVWATLREVITGELSERQRQVLQATVFDDVPLDELARHLGSNRNAVYKLLHDARRKLKARLEQRGLGVQEIMNLFAER